MTREPPHAMSAFFARPEDVERVVADLVHHGVPRDLIDIVVSPEANKAHYGGRARRLGTQTVRYAGIGALSGLLVGVVLSLEIILVFPGFEPPARELSMTQFLGPNVTMMIGLIIGAVVGALMPARLAGPLVRAQGREDILVAVRSIPDERLTEVTAILEAAGGVELNTETERRRRLRWW